MSKEVIAILCSDLHLSLTPPIARAGEKNWFEAMARPLSELSNLAHSYRCPVLCSGDIFDRWNPPPELINFAIKHLPKMYAVPGQHDLPFHSMEDIQRSAYWTLCEAGVVEHCIGEQWRGGFFVGGPNPQFFIGGYGWGEKIASIANVPTDRISIALVHEYHWIDGSGFEGAPTESKITANSKQFQGWDVVLIGDNHTPFQCKVGDTLIYNPGGFMRRKSDEDNRLPQVGLLYSDKTLEIHIMDTEKDSFVPQVREEVEQTGIKNFVRQMGKLQGAELDYVNALQKVLRGGDISERVRELLNQAIEECK